MIEQCIISKFPDEAMEGKRGQQCQTKTVGKTAQINLPSIKTIANGTLIIIIVNMIIIKANIH